jgi:hypothetical protein
MAKGLKRRIGDIEGRLREVEIRPMGRIEARYHAMAVAAIVLSGQPRIDEPLRHAWARTLRHYGITVKEPESWRDQVTAALQLFRIIMNGADESAQFTQIFKTAPVWLLQFTGTAVDARFLKFQLPDISSELVWGSAGYEDARRWPLLPLDTMDRGDPIPQFGQRLWIYLFCMVTSPEFPDRIDLPQEEKITDPIARDIAFALDLDRVPEEELSRYQRRRLREIAERISRL